MMPESAFTVHQVEIPADGVRLPGTFSVPAQVRSVVVFAHGSGSSRFSPRNQAVAQHLHAAHLATLLFDLLTPAEAADRANVFDIERLAHRLDQAVAWVRHQHEGSGRPVGLFGASTGAAAALLTAARDPLIAAVVSRGGRPDLAWEVLPDVCAPVLLIVGGEDRDVLELNRRALARLRAPGRLEIIPGATHLFEEPGALEQVAHLAREWFVVHMSATSPAARAP